MMKFFSRFSALQRAENSSIDQFVNVFYFRRTVSVLFSEPKIPQLTTTQSVLLLLCGFSALQRAENSSISGCDPHAQVLFRFQCSSASRKFLNAVCELASSGAVKFQCSSASRKFLNIAEEANHQASSLQFQCSSASRKFLNLTRPSLRWCTEGPVSVLFSEPKIPQFAHSTSGRASASAFQCSSASRKFLNALNNRV